MKYRVTLADAPPDSPFRDPEEFETWEETPDRIFFSPRGPSADGRR